MVRYGTAVGIFALVTIIFVSPILYNFNYWGIGDWDYQFYAAATVKSSIQDYHQFPLWDPHRCGGNVVLAHPAYEYFSPSFLLILLFGEVKGQKLLIITHLFFGMLGMYLLSRKFEMGRYASFLPPLIYMMSSIYPLHLVEGHTIWRAMAWVPFTFLYYLNCLESRDYKQALLSSFFLSMAFFDSGPYIFLYTSTFLLIYSLFRSVQEKEINPIKFLFLIYALTFLFGAFKFLPVLEFVSDTSIPLSEASGVQPSSFGIMIDSLFNRNQVELLETVAYHTPKNFQWGWHEYGAYVGLLPFGLFLLGGYLHYKRHWPLLAAGFIFLIIALGNASPVNLWALLGSAPVYNSLHGPSRFILMFIFCLSIFAGMGLTGLERRKKWLAIIAVFIIFIDLTLVNSPIFSKTFTVPPLEGDIKKSEFVQIVTPNMFDDMYTNFLHNIGTLNCYERLNPPIRAFPMGDPGYQGEVYLVFGSGEAEISYFSPNKISVDLETVEDNILVLNQNYYKGWKAEGRDVTPFNGLVSTEVTPQDNQVTFYYMPNSFLLGLSITLFSISFILYLLLRGQDIGGLLHV